MKIELWYVSLLLFVGFTLLIIYYFFLHRKSSKVPFYHKDHLEWEDELPELGHKIVHSVFLIGDAGAPAITRPDHNLELLKKMILEANENSTLIFLGDNIYPKGMPEKDHPLRHQSEKRLLAQMNIANGYKGRTIFISGNHDWNKGRKGGLEALLRQQKFIDEHFGSEQVMLPRNGCPGPVLYEANKDLAIIIINTQWWVHSGRRPLGKENGCMIDTEQEFFLNLQDMLEQHKDKKILVAGHHPMYSKAYHGGKFDLKQHLFPLTEAHKKLYIPLPVAGSIYPMYRKYIGSKEDMAHPRYRKLRRKLIEIFSGYPNLIYAAGHDHNLQYLNMQGQHYIVSGAGSKVTYVRKGRGAYFTHAHKGFFRIDYHKNGDVWMEVWEPGSSKTNAKLAYRKRLESKNSNLSAGRNKRLRKIKSA